MRRAELTRQLSAISAELSQITERKPLTREGAARLGELAREGQRLNSLPIEPDVRVALGRCVQSWRQLRWVPTSSPRLAEKTGRVSR